MHEDFGLSTAWTSCNHNAARFLVSNNFPLSFRHIPEQLFVFSLGDILFNFGRAFSLEIFVDEQLVVHLKIILDVLEGCFIVLYHKVCILANDMNLLDFLFVELIEHAVIALLVL